MLLRPFRVILRTGHHDPQRYAQGRSTDNPRHPGNGYDDDDCDIGNAGRGACGSRTRLRSTGAHQHEVCTTSGHSKSECRVGFIHAQTQSVWRCSSDEVFCFLHTHICKVCTSCLSHNNSPCPPHVLCCLHVSRPPMNHREIASKMENSMRTMTNNLQKLSFR